MSNKLEKILKLVEEYCEEKEETWSEGDFLSYSGPLMDAEEYKAGVKSLLSGWFIAGDNCREFENKFPKYMGKKYGIMTNSGSSANLLMVSTLTTYDKTLKEFHLTKGSKVITPVACFPTTVNPLVQNDLKPVFCRVELPNLTPDLDHIEQILENDDEIKAIMFAHPLGVPPDMDRLMNICDQYDLIFLEDACDALGGTYDGKKLGSFGLMSTCSFFPAHHMTTGQGGFISTDLPKIQRTLGSLAEWGRGCYCNFNWGGCDFDTTKGETACGNRFKSWLPEKDIVYDHRYVFQRIGYNLRPLDLQAAMGLEQIKKLPKFEKARRENYKLLTNIFSEYEEYFHLPVAPPKADPSWFAFLLTVKDSAPFTKQEFVSFLEQNNIQTRPFFSGNILHHPGYKELRDEYGDLAKEFPVAEKSISDTFFLGTYAGITGEKMEYISKTVEEFFNGRQ